MVPGQPSPSPYPQAGPVSPLLAVFLTLFVSTCWERGVGALLSGIGDIFLSNIWRNEYFFADISMYIYPYLPREYIYIF